MQQNIPFASGFSSQSGRNSHYWKTPFNMVHFNLALAGHANATASTVIATLPSGFRPSVATAFPLTLHTSNVSSELLIGTNGSMQMMTNVPVSAVGGISSGAFPTTS